MPSVAYLNWRTFRAAVLDEVEAAHSSIGGTAPGRRYATQQINNAYALLLAAEFQGFCRELHDECVGVLIKVIPVPLQEIVEVSLSLGRQLDRGNATPSALGSDFGRFEIRFWPSLFESDPRIQEWQRGLSELNEWRNAIAHSHFPTNLASATVRLRLKNVQNYRKLCGRLARAFDRLLLEKLQGLTGQLPW